MKTEEEIKSQIQRQFDHIDIIDFRNGDNPQIEAIIARSWINALKWVLEEE